MPDESPTAAPAALDRVCVVLHEPQDPVNIAGTVRAMKNMGVHTLRLVNPKPFDPSRIEVVAHDTLDIVARIAYFDTLDDALADCVRVAGFTARRRKAKRDLVEPRACAEELLAYAEQGTVALLFGREDAGLTNEALDRAHIAVTIPTSTHASLNLAQAVLIGLYELHLAAPGASRRLAPARKDAPASEGAHYEQLFGDVHRTLDAIGFFRTRNPELILRSIRTLAFRAAPDRREIEMLRSMAIEVRRALDRAAHEGTPPET